MGLFSRKKQEDKILPLPEFPKLSNEPSFPFYDEQVAEPKLVQPRTQQEFKKVVPTEDFNFNQNNFDKQEFEFNEFPQGKQILTLDKSEEKPLFVKINKYKETVKTIDSIKSKLEEAESIFKNLTNLKEQEEKELQEWQNSLEEIRQKLMRVDKSLFEV